MRSLDIPLHPAQPFGLPVLGCIAPAQALSLLALHHGLAGAPSMCLGHNLAMQFQMRHIKSLASH